MVFPAIIAIGVEATWKVIKNVRKSLQDSKLVMMPVLNVSTLRWQTVSNRLVDFQPRCQ